MSNPGTSQPTGSGEPRRSGRVVLRSGTWAWELQPRPDGIVVVYRHMQRYADELHAWIGDYGQATEEAMTERARSPLRRIWTDVVGVKWAVTVAPGWQRNAYTEFSTLVFDRGGALWMARIPSDLKLGDLTHIEMQALLEKT